MGADEEVIRGWNIDHQNTMDMIRTIASIEITAADKGNPRIQILAYSGGLMRVPGYGVVAVDLKGMAVPDSFPLLADHNTGLDGIVGSGSATIAEGTLSVEGILAAESEAAQKILALHRAGVKFQASIGAEPLRSEAVQGRATVNGRMLEGAFTLVRQSRLKEISITALGADASTNVQIQAKGTASMNNATTEPTTDPVQIERDRVAKILKACSGNWGEAGPQVQTLQARAISGEIELDALQASLLDLVRAQRPQAPIAGLSGSRPNVQPKILLAAACAAYLGMNAEKLYGAPAAQAAADLRAHSMLDLCAASLRLNGSDVPSDRSEMIRAAFSTTSLPNVLGNTLERSAAEAFQLHLGVWKPLCRVRNVKTFKAHTIARVLLGGSFQPVGNDGELKHLTLEDSATTVQAETSGAILTLTRKMVIDDDLGMLLDSAAAIGREGARTMADDFVKTILAGVGSHYAAANNNYIEGADTALSVAGLDAGMGKMTKATDAAGRSIGIRPRYLVVPPEIEFTARQLLTSAELWRYVAAAADNRPNGNPLQNRLELLVEPRISNSSFTNYTASGWFLFSDPANGAVNVALLDGKDTPTVEQVDLPANTLGVGWRGYIDFGFALGETVASMHSKGAA